MKWTNIKIGSCEGECLEFKILDQFSPCLFILMINFIYIAITYLLLACILLSHCHSAEELDGIYIATSKASFANL